MRVCTWNVNSVRLRIDQLARMAETLQPDVICLQETKVTNELFPLEACAALGYVHIATDGMKAYNGVAILSKRPIADIRTPGWCGRTDCRHLIATIDGIEIHNLYVPAGGDLPDPELNPKFAHKLQFLDELATWYAGHYSPDDKLLLLGDLNVAPLETDVWSHKQMLKVVSHTPVEVARLEKLQSSLAWVDAVRAFVPADQKLFTWWSYRATDWELTNRGRRLDHLWVTPGLRHRLRSAEVFKATRDWQPPSDHVPVLVELGV